MVWLWLRIIIHKSVSCFSFAVPFMSDRLVVQLPLVRPEETCFWSGIWKIFWFNSSRLSYGLERFHFDLAWILRVWVNVHINAFCYKLWNKRTFVTFCQFTFMFVMFALSLQNSKNAEQCFSLTANHSCWDWVRRREEESEEEERLKQRVREGKWDKRRTSRILTGKK